MLDFPIFSGDWGADEELLLVEGLEIFGIGNWEQISEHIGTKNKLECENHYNAVVSRARIRQVGVTFERSMAWEGVKGMGGSV